MNYSQWASDMKYTADKDTFSLRFDISGPPNCKKGTEELANG